MEKVVVIIRRSGSDDAWCEHVRGPVARELLDLGLPGVAVNVRDEPVRAAMVAPTTLDPPGAAVVGIWTRQYYGEQLTSALRVLRKAAGEDGAVDAYLVTESTPLPPPDAGGGARTAGLANVALLRRPADLDHRDWLRIWHAEHTAVAVETQGTFGYTQNTVVCPITDNAPQVDGIVEELFPDAAVSDPYAFYGAADDADLHRRVGRLMESCARFGAQRDVDVIPTSRYLLRSPFRAAAGWSTEGAR